MGRFKTTKQKNLKKQIALEKLKKENAINAIIKEKATAQKMYSISIDKKLEDFRDQLTANFLVMMNWVMHDSEGYSKKRLERITTKFMELAIDMQDKHLEIGDIDLMYDTLKKETDFDIKDCILKCRKAVEGAEEAQKVG